jgi:hypothetical protein
MGLGKQSQEEISAAADKVSRKRLVDPEACLGKKVGLRPSLRGFISVPAYLCWEWTPCLPTGSEILWAARIFSHGLSRPTNRREFLPIRSGPLQMWALHSVILFSE